MTLTSITALFVTMAVLAAMPSLSVFTVSARSASSGFIHGAFTAAGIVVGDIIFIIITLLGLALLAEQLGGFFVYIKYLGGVYLLWLGIHLWRSATRTHKVETRQESSLLASFMAGLLITLADQKALLFYFGFFPAFVELSAITALDAGIIMAITIISVGGVKLVYAFMADRARHFLNRPNTIMAINSVAGTVMIGTGIFLLFTS